MGHSSAAPVVTVAVARACRSQRLEKDLNYGQGATTGGWSKWLIHSRVMPAPSNMPATINAITPIVIQRSVFFGDESASASASCISILISVTAGPGGAGNSV